MERRPAPRPSAWDVERRQITDQPQVVFRNVIDGVAMVKAFADPRPRGSQKPAKKGSK